MPALAMPGHKIPGFDAMAEVVAQAGIYGPADYRRIVQQLLEHWRIGELTGLSGEGAAAELLNRSAYLLGGRGLIRRGVRDGVRQLGRTLGDLGDLFEHLTGTHG